jgi:hypothetical protein
MKISLPGPGAFMSKASSLFALADVSLSLAVYMIRNKKLELSQSIYIVFIVWFFTNYQRRLTAGRRFPKVRFCVKFCDKCEKAGAMWEGKGTCFVVALLQCKIIKELWWALNSSQFDGSTHYSTRADFHIFKRKGGKISSGVQAAPLSELRRGLGVRIKDFHTK